MINLIMAVAGAISLAELQLRINWHKEMVQWMKCKIRLALVGYLQARSCLQSQLWLEAWPRCSLKSTGTGVGG